MLQSAFVDSLSFFPPLQITDKRVSRKHAVLEVVGDQLRIKPVTWLPDSFITANFYNLFYKIQMTSVILTENSLSRSSGMSDSKIIEVNMLTWITWLNFKKQFLEWNLHYAKMLTFSRYTSIFTRWGSHFTETDSLKNKLSWIQDSWLLAPSYSCILNTIWWQNTQ